MKIKYLFFLIVLVILVGIYFVLANSLKFKLPITATSTPVTAGLGERCGGNMTNAPQCLAGLHCVPEAGSHLPFGDVGGVCAVDDVTTTPVSRPGKIDTGVEGIVTIGPTCPVERIPPDPACADKPYPTTLVLASTVIGKNDGVLVTTDAQGYFSQELSLGTYTIRAQSNTMLPRLSPVTFTVVEHQVTSLNLQFDSGIR